MRRESKKEGKSTILNGEDRQYTIAFCHFDDNYHIRDKMIIMTMDTMER